MNGPKPGVGPCRPGPTPRRLFTFVLVFEAGMLAHAAGLRNHGSSGRPTPDQTPACHTAKVQRRGSRIHTRLAEKYRLTADPVESVRVSSCVAITSSRTRGVPNATYR